MYLVVCKPILPVSNHGFAVTPDSVAALGFRMAAHRSLYVVGKVQSKGVINGFERPNWRTCDFLMLEEGPVLVSLLVVVYN